MTTEMMGVAEVNFTFCDTCNGAGVCLDGACLACATTGDREAGDAINAAMMRRAIPESLTRVVAKHASLVTWQGIALGHGRDGVVVLWSVWFCKRPPEEVLREFRRVPRLAHIPGSKGVILDWYPGDRDAWEEDARRHAKRWSERGELPQ